MRLNYPSGPLNAKQQERLLEKQFTRYYRSMKNKCLRFTFPISYPCLSHSKKKNRAASKKSLRQSFNRLKSAVSILFNEDPQSTRQLSEQNQSFNANRAKHHCQSCGSFLSNGICSCIVHQLLQLNN